MKFKYYLINESRIHLSQKMGDVIDAMQSLQDDSKHLGPKPLVRATKNIIQQIRKVLHTDWSDTELSTLKNLQKVGVALSKAIDEGDELRDTIEASLQLLLDTSQNDKQPVNDIGNNEEPAT